MARVWVDMTTTTKDQLEAGEGGLSNRISTPILHSVFNTIQPFNIPHICKPVEIITKIIKIAYIQYWIILCVVKVVSIHFVSKIVTLTLYHGITSSIFDWREWLRIPYYLRLHHNDSNKLVPAQQVMRTFSWTIRPSIWSNGHAQYGMHAWIMFFIVLLHVELATMN